MATKSVHQNAVEALLEIGIYPQLAKRNPDVRPTRQRSEIPALLREAIAQAHPRYPEETNLFKIALSLEQPNADWLKLTEEQQLFYESLAFHWEDDDLRVRYAPDVAAID